MILRTRQIWPDKGHTHNQTFKTFQGTTNGLDSSNLTFKMPLIDQDLEFITILSVYSRYGVYIPIEMAYRIYFVFLGHLGECFIHCVLLPPQHCSVFKNIIMQNKFQKVKGNFYVN